MLLGNRKYILAVLKYNLKPELIRKLINWCVIAVAHRPIFPPACPACRTICCGLHLYDWQVTATLFGISHTWPSSTDRLLWQRWMLVCKQCCWCCCGMNYHDAPSPGRSLGLCVCVSPFLCHSQCACVCVCPTCVRAILGEAAHFLWQQSFCVYIVPSCCR